jgi:molybdenum cofactor cytidylyltransferase
MGSSIVTGLEVLTKIWIEASIIMVCDQPYISSRHLLKLIEVYNSATPKIVATSYGNTIGVPVLFDRRYFEALQKLKGNEGAKKLLMQYSEDLSTVVFQKASIDIDTMEDYDKLEK